MIGKIAPVGQADFYSVGMSGRFGPEYADNPQMLNPWVSAYLLVIWVPEAERACEGFGFPFDRPHLMLYQRLREAYPALKTLKPKKSSCSP